MSTPAFALRRPRRAFSLVEVILALGVMAIAIVSILGLIGSTLTDVRQTEDIIAGTSTIGKMNAILSNTIFWDSQTKDESVYWWVYNSKSDSPTVFLFYDAVPSTTTGPTGSAPIQRVARFNVNTTELNTPDTTFYANSGNGVTGDTTRPQLPVQVSLSDFANTLAAGRVTGAVIAMTVSVSPLMKNFPTKGPDGNEATKYYHDPTSGSLFPDSQNGLPADPSGLSGSNVYPEGYFPILVQAFTVPVGSFQANADTDTLARQIVDSLNAGNRIFTYTTAKLR
ncbi:MAG TPA: hypothetical protein VHC95_12645 [Opitutales bacterium]|nr:hypothetical protein [Opitutales bacterium]